MNKRKGFFRLTLVLSFLCGILTLYFPDNIFEHPTFRKSKHRTVKIPLLSDWGDKTRQEKLDIIDKLDTKLRDWQKKRIQEEEEERKKAAEEREKIAEEWEKAGLNPWMTTVGELIKINKEREKRGLPPLPLRPFPRIPGVGIVDIVYIDYYKLSPKEKLNVKKQLRGKITSGEKEMPKDKGRRNYYVSLSPDWKKISFLILTTFTMGFASVWLIYAFIRWVVIGFIMGGFKYKSTP